MQRGEKRPINKEIDRKLILESLKFVDEVIIFNNLTPLSLIQQIQPDIIVKGGDYKPNEVVGNHISDVVIFNYINGFSTTSIIERAKL